MNDDAVTRMPARQSALDIALELLQRGAALSCLVYGIGYWVRLLGLFEGAEWRFDLMPVYWQVAAAPLAVLFPFAAVGLWMLASWGPVVWFICAMAEIVMHGFLPELYGRWPLTIALHVLVAVSYTVLRVLIYLRRREAAD